MKSTDDQRGVLAERVIAAVMTKDRAHMHLDTVFTFLDRDIVIAYPKVVPNIRAISLRPGAKAGDFHVTVEKDFLSAVAEIAVARHWTPDLKCNKHLTRPCDASGVSRLQSIVLK